MARVDTVDAAFLTASGCVEAKRDLSSSLTSVELVAQLFPNRASEVARLTANSEPFQSLCEDYELAVDTLRDLEQKNQPQDAERIVEYRRLIADLKREFEACLGAEIK